MAFLSSEDVWVDEKKRSDMVGHDAIQNYYRIWSKKYKKKLTMIEFISYFVTIFFYRENLSL